MVRGIGVCINEMYVNTLEHYSNTNTTRTPNQQGNDDLSIVERGVNSIKDKIMKVEIPVPSNFTFCQSCTDQPPDTHYNCSQQSLFGKCSESWMQGYCCRTCFGCDKSCGVGGVGVDI